MKQMKGIDESVKKLRLSRYCNEKHSYKHKGCVAGLKCVAIAMDTSSYREQTTNDLQVYLDCFA